MWVWLRATRPLAHANLAPPILLGQALAHALGTPIDPALFVAAHAFGLADHLAIVFANDYADRAIDAANDTYSLFSGGSRVLPDGLVSPEAMRRASIVAVAALLVVSALAALAFARPWLIVFALAALGLMWAYSFPPLLLSHGAGGALAQGLGVGAVLPLLGFYAQRGSLEGFPWLVLAPLVMLGCAGNGLTALPDTPSDARFGKRTWPVRRGEARARLETLAVTAHALLAICALTLTELAPPVAGGRLVVVLSVPLAMLTASLTWIATASARNREACFRFVFLAAGAGTVAQLGWALALLFA